MRALRLILVLLGFTAVTAQVLLMRELLMLFSGTEITLGFMLAGWLVWTALGSGVLGRLQFRSADPRQLVAVLEVLIALVLPLTILGARAGKSALTEVPSEMLAPGVVLMASLAALAPFCALSGWLFAAGSRMCAAALGASAAKATGTVYLLEAAGSGAGGVLATVFLVRFLDVLQIALLLSFLNLAAAASLLIRARAFRRTALILFLTVLPGIVLPFVAPQLNIASLARLWRGFSLIANRNSVYGDLAVVSHEGSTTIYENSLPVVTVPDVAAAEEAVHYALLEHPSPESLLLIGGGVNGSLAEVLKHRSLRRVDYVELDPAILDLAAKYFSASWSPVLADPRLHVHRVDGRLFLRTTAERFDVIIVYLPDPQTAQLNRFYTLEFFREAAKKLRTGGVLSLQLTSAENYISPAQADFLRSIRKTLGAVFSQLAFIPGDTLYLFASNSAGVLVDNSEGLLERLRRRGIQTSYVREYYLPFEMSPDRMAELAAELRPLPTTPLNRDFSPVAYYFDTVLWSTRFGPGASLWLERLENVSFGWVLATAVLAALGLAAFLRFLPARLHSRLAAGYSAAALGFTLIGLEILLLMGFQALYGYVYYELAIVVAMFMAGMALGCWQAMRRGDTVRSGDLRRLAVLQCAAALAPLVLWLLFRTAATTLGPLLFSVLALLCGSLGGLQFPLASRIYFAGSPEGRPNPGTLYALDLAGSCLGALLFSAWLLPLFGFRNAALVISCVCLAPALLAVSAPAESRIR